MKRISLVLAATAVLAVTAVAQNPFAKFIGKPAPAFKLTDMNGKVHTNASLRGKPVLIDFWATWCGPCKAALPTMQSLHTKFGRQGLVVIGSIVMDGDTDAQNKTKAQSYQREHKYTYTFATGGDPLATKMGVQGIPTFVFIDRKGVVRAVEVGFDGKSTPNAFEKIVKGIL